MTKNTLRKILHEAIKLDVEKGDVILTGRFKNKRRIVKTIGTDRFGQPTINGKSILKFKIEKHMPKNKMSAKTREEMNEMKQLRRTIRMILLEGNSHVDKAYTLGEMICSGDIDSMTQAIELGITLGWISEDNLIEMPVVKELNGGRGYMSQQIFDISFPDGDPEASTYFEMDAVDPMLMKACRFYQKGQKDGEWALKHGWEYTDNGDHARVCIIGA